MSNRTFWVAQGAIFLTFIVIMLSGCSSLLGFPALNAPPKPETTYQYEESFEKIPQAVVVGDKYAVVEHQIRTVKAGFVNQEKPLNFWQRFCNWLAGWGILTVVLVGGCLAFGITGPALWLFARFQKFKQTFETFRKTTKQMVRAIEDSKAVQANPELGNKLSSMLDTDSKKLIDDIRRE